MPEAGMVHPCRACSLWVTCTAARTKGNRPTHRATREAVKYHETSASRIDQAQNKGKPMGRASQSAIPPPPLWVSPDGLSTPLRKHAKS